MRLESFLEKDLLYLILPLDVSHGSLDSITISSGTHSIYILDPHDSLHKYLILLQPPHVLGLTSVLFLIERCVNNTCMSVFFTPLFLFHFYPETSLSTRAECSTRWELVRLLVSELILST